MTRALYFSSSPTIFTQGRGQPSSLRVFIGVNDISGNYSALWEGFQAIGLSATLVVESQHRFGYGKVQSIPNVNARCDEVRQRCLSLRLPWGIRILARGLISETRRIGNFVIRFHWAIRMIRSHDVFIFGFGSSLLPRNLDLPIISLLPKKFIISNLEHGSEARPPVADAAWRQEIDLVVPTRTLRILTKQTKRMVVRHEQFADIIIGNPLSTGYFAKKPIVNTYFLGRPLRPGTTTPSRSNKSNPLGDRPLRVAHIPSHALSKGTDVIEATLTNLEAQGSLFEFVSISNVLNKEVLDILSGVDLLIDQIYSDRYWSKIAAEAATLGKPTLVAGYGFDLLEKFVPSHLRPPVFSCHPEEFEDLLRSILADPESIQEMGSKAQTFASTTYKAANVAERYLRLLRPDQIPPVWFFDPEDIDYPWGVGQDTQLTSANYRRLWRKYGARALQLGHKPKSLRLIRERFDLHG